MRILTHFVFLSLGIGLGVGICGRWNAAPQAPDTAEPAPVTPVPPLAPAAVTDQTLREREKLREIDHGEFEPRRPVPATLPDVHDPAGAERLREQLRNGQFTPL